MVGLRFFFLQPHQQNWLTDGTIDWLWPASERAQIPIALMASNHLPAVGRIAERHPSLRFADRPLCQSTRHHRRRSPCQSARASGARQIPQCRGQGDRAPGNSSQPYPYLNIHSYIQQIHGMFSSQRMFRGTDITRTPCSWRQCVTMFTEELPWLEGRDLELVMGRAVCDWIGWTLSG
jgi:hypothetical protein